MPKGSANAASKPSLSKIGLAQIPCWPPEHFSRCTTDTHCCSRPTARYCRAVVAYKVSYDPVGGVRPVSLVVEDFLAVVTAGADARGS